MSLDLSSQRFTMLCEIARFLVSRTGEHQAQLDALVITAEADVRSAEAALTGATHPFDDARGLLSAELLHATARAQTARELCISARQDHVAALRLLGHLEPDHCADEWLGRRPHAVLVVDDSEDVRELVARALRSAGFVVRTAANGLEGTHRRL